MNDNRFQLLVARQEDDLALVQRFRDGDWSALDALYGRYARHVFQRSWRIVREHRLAMATTQDTFALFVAHLSCECGRPVRDWLFDACSRLAIGTNPDEKGEPR